MKINLSISSAADGNKGMAICSSGYNLLFHYTVYEGFSTDITWPEKGSPGSVPVISGAHECEKTFKAHEFPYTSA